MVIVSKETDKDQVRACITCINLLTRNRKKEEQKQAAPPPILRYYEVFSHTQAAELFFLLFLDHLFVIVYLLLFIYLFILGSKKDTRQAS
jgi:hypothetical protein